MDNDTRHTTHSLEQGLDAWGQSVAQAPPPPLPHALQHAVRGQASQHKGRAVTIALWTGSLAAAAILTVMLMRPQPAPQVAPPIVQSPAASTPRAAQPTMVLLTRANRSFDVAHLRLIDTPNAHTTTQSDTVYTPRDAHAALQHPEAL